MQYGTYKLLAHLLPILICRKPVVLILLKFDIVDGDISEGKSNKTKQNKTKFSNLFSNLNYIKQKPRALHSVIAKYYCITRLRKSLEFSDTQKKKKKKV